MPTTVAITGAGGFIGRHLVAALLRRSEPAEIRALLLPGEEVPEDWDDAVRIHRGDVTRPETLERFLDDADVLVHLAAVVTDWGPWEHYRRVTVEGTENVVRRLPEGTRVVLASSIVVYGDRLGRERCHEDLEWGRPTGNYSRAKQMQERLARELAAERGLDLAVVRPANVYGPGSRPWVEMVLPLLRARRPTLMSGGGHDAGLVHVENLVDLLLLAAERDEAARGTFNAADGEGVTWRRYLGDLAEIVDAPPPRSLPRPLAGPVALACEAAWGLLRLDDRPPITREAVQLTARGLEVPGDRARELLGWRPGVGYEDGIEGIRRHLAS